jgi:hypothetical protein
MRVAVVLAGLRSPFPVLSEYFARGTSFAISNHL